MRVASCYVSRAGLVLAVWNSKHQAWLLPGGKVEPGEAPVDAALRELHEETGIRALHVLSRGTGTSSFDPGVEVDVFHVDVGGAMPETREPGNQVGWVTPEALCRDHRFGPFYRRFFATLGLTL